MHKISPVLNTATRFLLAIASLGAMWAASQLVPPYTFLPLLVVGGYAAMYLTAGSPPKNLLIKISVFSLWGALLLVPITFAIDYMSGASVPYGGAATALLTFPLFVALLAVSMIAMVLGRIMIAVGK